MGSYEKKDGRYGIFIRLGGGNTFSIGKFCKLSLSLYKLNLCLYKLNLRFYKLRLSLQFLRTQTGKLALGGGRNYSKSFLFLSDEKKVCCVADIGRICTIFGVVKFRLIMKRKIVILVWAFCLAGVLRGQTAQDSLAIVSAQWKVSHFREGIVHKSVSIPLLYRCPQSIDLIEIPVKRGLKIGIAVSPYLQETSKMASRCGALAAINGSYFDMRKGNSVCYLKVDRQVIDTTTTSEFALRVTGAVYVCKGKLKLIPWGRQTEKAYGRKRGSVLASGPLLLKDGLPCDWSLCESGFIETKHPRSAVCQTKDGKILLVTVNGRFAERAGGMSIPELAHLLRVLGGKDALNLDGGGSTTLWLTGTPDNGIVNYPCDNKCFDHRGERKVANIVYVYR